MPTAFHADPALGAALQALVCSLDLSALSDRDQGGAPLGLHPSLDLAVVVFSAAGGARGANVLFSREHPGGFCATPAAGAGPLQGLRFDADLRDAAGTSLAWSPGADWAQLPWQALTTGPGPRFVAPYPASLIKLLVAVGVAWAWQRGALPEWPADLVPMVIDSDNDATDRLVALLHRVGGIGPLHAALAAWGLGTLRLANTQPNGGWRNADGAGVGHLQMTAWDTVRLLWLIDPDAPPAPWLAPGTARLSAPVQHQLMALLRAQRVDTVLSAGRLRGLPGWRAGLPDAPTFAHKTGTTDNYASDAGVLREGRCHAVVALISTLGRRFAPHPRCDTPWAVQDLGAALYRLLQGFSPSAND